MSVVKSEHMNFEYYAKELELQHVVAQRGVRWKLVSEL
jgi:hypothetical protein